jgi:prepilin-type N-terminal cleavage/methylation domain-containing protein
VYTRASTLLRRARRNDGFGMIELLCAMSILAMGILALFAMFDSGMTQLHRASAVTTAAAIADSEMENFRAIRFEVIGLDDAQVVSADATYKANAAYRDETTPTTTLAAGLDSAGTTLSVASASGFPTTAPFRIKIDSEIILVDAGAGTTTWTVKRAQDGSAAAAHASGAGVTQKKLAHVVACGTGTCTTAAPTKTVTGADGRSYRVDTFMTWHTVTSAAATAGRNVKLVTLVVRDSATARTYARVSSSFDESTGQ